MDRTGISVIAFVFLFLFFFVFLSSASVISRLCVDWDTNGFVWRRGHKNPEIWWNFSQAAVDRIFVFFLCVCPPARGTSHIYIASYRYTIRVNNKDI